MEWLNSCDVILPILIVLFFVAVVHEMEKIERVYFEYFSIEEWNKLSLNFMASIDSDIIRYKNFLSILNES